MRDLEAALTTDWQEVSQLAGADPTRAQVESTRRAAKRLAELGRAETRRISRGRVDATARYPIASCSVLAIRLARTPEQRKADAAAAVATFARLKALL